MGVSVEQWRAAIGQWSGGTSGQCVTLQNSMAQTSDHNGYRLIRFLVLVSLLVIGCVELNPGPDNETSASPQSGGSLPTFRRLPEAVEPHGHRYEIKMAAFLFARALNSTEEFRLASNIDGAGAFDDLVFRYRLREPDIWKTCFIQLKHKKNEGKNHRSSLKRMSGDFSLFKYFESYCHIKREYSTDSNLKQCGLFHDFDFIIYTNASMESNSPLQGGDCDPVSILSSGSNYGKYITFDETCDRDIFEFFEELSQYHDFIRKLDSLLNRGTFEDKEINENINSFQNSVTNKAILGKVNSLKSSPSKGFIRKLTKELEQCDFSLVKEFLTKVKIFHSQTKEEFLKTLIVKEIKDACKASPSVANYIYTKFEEGFYKWWEKSGNVVWLSKNAELWQGVKKYFITEITEISKAELQDIVGCGVRFNQQHIQRLSDAIKRNTFLNINTNSTIRTLHKLKTYQALNCLCYKNSLFIGLKSLMIRHKEIRKLWPCKWSAALVIDCDCDGNVADTLLDIFQKHDDCLKGSENSDEYIEEAFADILQKYEKNVIFISSRQHKYLDSRLREDLCNIYTDYEDTCNFLDLDEESQKQILRENVDFQGKKIALETLLDTDTPEFIKSHIDSDVISLLLSREKKLCVGRKMGDHSKYSVPRVLEHHIYVKDDILKLTDKAVTFAVSGLRADQLKKYLPPGEKICEFEYDETKISHSFKIPDSFSMPANSVERVAMMHYHRRGKGIKPKDIRYVVLGNLRPDSDFRELKALCKNVHWIHMEDGSFLWKDSNCKIDIIRRYIDDTKYKKYDIKSVMEHNDRRKLLVAEPGMGKSTFLSYMEHEIKKWKPSVWVLRINLHEHTRALENMELEKECMQKCKMFLWNAAHSPEQDALTLVEKVFVRALETRGKMIIIMDGFDEISPDYSTKVEMLIRTIRDKTASEIWVSSRFSYRQDLEDSLVKVAFTLQPFSTVNQIQFLAQYWNGIIKISKEGNLRIFAEKILRLCSKNFTEKDVEFTGIPLQIMMLGEAFVKEAEEYCSSGKVNLPQKFNLLYLFRKFSEMKYDIYFSEKNEMDRSKPEVRREIKSCLEKHMICALISLFSRNELKQLLGKRNASRIEQAEEFLRSGWAQQLGIITDISDGTPHYIHRHFAEYFAAKWLADNFTRCKKLISKTLFNSTYEVTRNIFDRMLAEDSEIHTAVLNNDIVAVEEFMKKDTAINISDRGGRTALHLAASYNSPLTQKLLSVRGVNAKKSDAVLKWTPLRYADRTKSWRAMDVLLQNGANADDILLTRRNIEDQEWGQAALWECASKGHKKLLEFMLNCGTDVNAVVGVPENLHEKCTLLHRASFCNQVEVVRLLVDRRADINIRNANKNTALHLAIMSGSVDIIKLLPCEEMSDNFTNTHGSMRICGVPNGPRVTWTVVEGDDVSYWNEFRRTRPMDIGCCHYANANASHLMRATDVSYCLKLPQTSVRRALSSRLESVGGAALNSNLEDFLCCAEEGAGTNIRNAKNYTALHVAAHSGTVNIIELLLDEGMSVNLTDRDGNTPLHVSAAYGNLETAKALIERTAGLNNTNINGSTPLMLAAYSGKLEVVRYLTEIGADINIRDAKNHTALHYAAHSDSVDIIKFLLDKGMSVNVTNRHDVTPLQISAARGNLEQTKAFVEGGASLNNANIYGYTPLMLAAYNGRLEVVRYLTEIGADVNIRNANDDTALHVAGVSDNADIIKLLLDKGVSVNLSNKSGNTPLHVSAALGNLEATKAFVKGAAGLSSTNENGYTPLRLAADKGKLEVVRYLTELGADVYIQRRHCPSLCCCL